jgi:hypothetical protein
VLAAAGAVTLAAATMLAGCSAPRGVDPGPASIAPTTTATAAAPITPTPTPTPTATPTPSPTPAALTLSGNGIGDMTFGDTTALARVTALWGEPDRTELGDDPSSGFSICGTPWISGYTWGTLEVLADDGTFSGWQLVGGPPALPAGAALPLGLTELSTLAQIEAATGSTVEATGGSLSSLEPAMLEAGGIIFLFGSADATATPVGISANGIFCT